MQYFSYVIFSAESGQFYYGYFEDLDKILSMHNNNQIDVTKGKGPWAIVYSESYDTRLRAIRQSRFYRTAKGQYFLKKILNF